MSPPSTRISYFICININFNTLQDKTHYINMFFFLTFQFITYFNKRRNLLLDNFSTNNMANMFMILFFENQKYQNEIFFPFSSFYLKVVSTFTVKNTKIYSLKQSISYSYLLFHQLLTSFLPYKVQTSYKNPSLYFNPNNNYIWWGGVGAICLLHPILQRRRILTLKKLYLNAKDVSIKPYFLNVLQN